MRDLIDIRKVKERADKCEDPLKSLILSEPDFLPIYEYLVKSTLWMMLKRMERIE